MCSVTVDGVGEVMMLMIERGRPMILVGPADDPDRAELIWVGPKFFRLRSAQRHGKFHYFRLYHERYRFRHPEDPHARPGEVLPASVAVAQGGAGSIASHVYDPDRRTH